MVDFWWQNFCQFYPRNRFENLSLRSSPPSSLQEKKFATWSSLWEYPRRMVETDFGERVREDTAIRGGDQTSGEELRNLLRKPMGC